MTRRPKLPPAYRLVALETVDSTNAEAKRLAARGEDEGEDGTVVWARQQTAGRGRRGRQWDSPEGNLHCSLIMRPECPVETALQLGFVAALAVCDAIARVAEPGHEVWCKWPNDVLLGDRKVAGILLESEAGADAMPKWVVLGVGVNVAHFPEDVEFPATSLREEGCRDVDEVDLLEAFAQHFLTWVNRWLDDGFVPVRKHWLQRTKGLGEAIEVRLDNETLSGTFADLDEDGALILEVEGGGRRRISAGDVYFAAE